MATHSQLKLMLMRARTELAFLLSEEVHSQASQVRNARARVNELLEAIAVAAGGVSSASLNVRGGHAF
jgi:hypothetical protein